MPPGGALHILQTAWSTFSQYCNFYQVSSAPCYSEASDHRLHISVGHHSIFRYQLLQQLLSDLPLPKSLFHYKMTHILYSLNVFINCQSFGSCFFYIKLISHSSFQFFAMKMTFIVRWILTRSESSPNIATYQFRCLLTCAQKFWNENIQADNTICQ